MASELERFLQQAAERLAEKIEQATNPNPRVPTSSTTGPRSVRSAERARWRLDAEVVDAEIVETSTRPSERHDSTHSLSHLGPESGLPHDFRRTGNETTSEPSHGAFDHGARSIPHAAGRPRTGTGETEKSIDLQLRAMDVSPLVQMLRQPDTLRAAFIASEIFSRKF